MAIENLHNFLQDYFIANHCDVKVNGENVDVQLTDKLDERLMNRPFYWQYVKKLGINGEPQTLRLTTKQENLDTDYELIHFGTPRLQQIFSHLAEQGKCVRLYESVHVFEQTALHPWLVVNLKINYTGKQKKEELKSIGINMINGIMINKMFDSLEKISWQTKISDYCYTISPLIKLKNGYQRILNYLTEQIKTPEHGWAVDSWQTMEEEKELLNYFYSDSASNQEQELYEMELATIEDRYQPKIEFEVINGGIFYVCQSTSHAIIHRENA